MSTMLRFSEYVLQEESEVDLVGLLHDNGLYDIAVQGDKIMAIIPSAEKAAEVQNFLPDMVDYEIVVVGAEDSEKDADDDVSVDDLTGEEEYHLVIHTDNMEQDVGSMPNRKRFRKRKDGRGSDSR